MHNLVTRLLAAAGAGINAPPDPNGLPGSGQLLTLLSGLRWVCLFACVAAIGAGGLTWSFASHGNNPYYTSRAKTAVLVGAVGALLVGAAPSVVQWFFTLGGQVGG